jgi:tocopherol O-methyltransferase
MKYISDSGLKITSFDDLSSRVSRTWDLAAGLVRNPALWRFAATHGKDFLAFLKSIAAMKAGYKSGALVYGLILAEKR